MKDDYTYTLPSYLSCYLINNDSDGISEEEKAEIDLFLEKKAKKNIYVVGFEMDHEWFAHRNDLNNLGGMVCEYLFRKSRQH